MPSRSSTLRNSSGESLFSSATRRIVRSTVVSSTRMPVSFAYWSTARSMIRRSSTCLSRISFAGAVMLDAFICCSRMRRCSFVSHCVIASSLTMTSTRSSGTGFASARAGAAAAGACAHAMRANSSSTTPNAGRRRLGILPAIGAEPFRIRGAVRYGRARAARYRWWARSPARCAAEVRAGWFRHARAR